VIERTTEGDRLLRSANEVVAEVDDRLSGEQADPVMRRIGGSVRSASVATK